VVYSILAPGEPVQIYLNKTVNSIFPVDKSPYPEAKAFICGPDSNWIELMRAKADTTVFIDSKNLVTIERGKTYSLKVVLSNTTVRAQTTIPTDPATINQVICTPLKPEPNYSYSVLINGKWVSGNNNYLRVSYSPPKNSDCGYFFEAFSQGIFSNTPFPFNGNTLETNYFVTLPDSTSFLLKLITTDPFLNKYKAAIGINSYQSQNATWTTAILLSYGGVLPQFSNITNGVGLFGSYVTESKRVAIIKPTE
jgi:hypothetical protein